MIKDSKRISTSFVLFVTISLITISFLLQGNVGLYLNDEGFLWYGTWRTSLGEIPRRDFKGYDPLRYFWTAGVSLLFNNNGIINLRLAESLFLAIGFFFGLMTIREFISSRVTLIFSALLLLIWISIPSYKPFDHTIALVLLYYAFKFLKADYSIKRIFAIGILVGIAACVGRNHGVYAFIIFGALILIQALQLTQLKLILKSYLIWGMGIIAGYLPMLLFFLFIPGFFDSFWSNIVDLVTRENLSMALSFPWPWNINFEQGRLEVLSAISLSILTILLIWFFLSLCIALWKGKIENSDIKSLIVVLIIIQFVYYHNFYSRTDIFKFTTSSHALIIGLICLCSYRKNFPRITGIRYQLIFLIASIPFSIGLRTPIVQKIAASIMPVSDEYSFRKMNIKGDMLWIRNDHADRINNFIKEKKELVRPEENVLIVPNWPGAYNLIEQKSPLFENYFLFQKDKDKQLDQIQELEEKNVNWVLYSYQAVLRSDSLTFKDTHYKLWQYIQTHFEEQSNDSILKYQWLKRVKYLNEIK